MTEADVYGVRFSLVLAGDSLCQYQQYVNLQETLQHAAKFLHYACHW